MSLAESEPLAELQSLRFGIVSLVVEIEEFDDELLFTDKGEKVKIAEHYLKLNDRRAGLVHWETTGDGKIGCIDGLDVDENIPAYLIEQLDWAEVARHMHLRHYPGTSLIEHPDGRSAFPTEV